MISRGELNPSKRSPRISYWENILIAVLQNSLSPLRFVIFSMQFDESDKDLQVKKLEKHCDSNRLFSVSKLTRSWLKWREWRPSFQWEESA